MPSIFKEFYYGNICPADHIFPQGEDAEKYKALFKAQVEIGDQLERRLDAQGRKQFDAYRDMQIDVNSMEHEGFFLYAFRLGARMTMELLNPYGGGVSEDF